MLIHEIDELFRQSFVNNRRDCFAQKFIVSEFPINVRKKCESPRFSDPLFVPFLVTLIGSCPLS